MQEKSQQKERDMKITKIETILAGTRHLFVKVHTDEGITGIGESALWGSREGVIGTQRKLQKSMTWL